MDRIEDARQGAMFGATEAGSTTYEDTLRAFVAGYGCEVHDPRTNDAVFRPNHYARFAIEPITFITANNLGFLAGNVIKYTLRHDAKNGREDLLKARRYLDIMIEDLDRRAAGKPLKMEAV